MVNVYNVTELRFANAIFTGLTCGFVFIPVSKFAYQQMQRHTFLLCFLCHQFCRHAVCIVAESTPFSTNTKWKWVKFIWRFILSSSFIQSFPEVNFSKKLRSEDDTVWEASKYTSPWVQPIERWMQRLSTSFKRGSWIMSNVIAPRRPHVAHVR